MGSVAEVGAPLLAGGGATDLSLFERRFLQGFMLSLVLISFPNDLVFYMSPFFFAAWGMLLGGVISARRILLVTGGLLLISALAMALDHLAGQRVNVAGLALSLLTYAPVIVLLGISPGLRLSAAFTRSLAVYLSGFVLIQAAIGVAEFLIAQRMGLFPGDYVSGTFGLFDVITGPTINQVTFTFTTLSIAVFLWAYREIWIARIASAAALGVSVIAQSGHQIFFFMFVLVAAMMLRTLKVATVLRAALISVAALGGLLLTYPNTLYVASEWQRKLLDPSISPKIRTMVDVAGIWDARFLFVGTGFGQFTSRAALFSSGDYLSVNLPAPLVGQSYWFSTYMVPQIAWYRVIGESSAMAQPFFSVLTLLVEGGGLLFLVAAIGLVCLVLRQGAVARAHQDQTGDLAFFVSFLLMFWVMCSLIENYAELVQGIWTPCLLLIVALARQRDALARLHQERLANG